MRAGSDLRISAVVVVALAVLAATSTAQAQPAQSAAATAQFDKGRALMKEKKYPEACAAFEQSQKLEPQFGTQFNMADCQARIGKLASAWLAYKELSQRDTNDGRKKEAARRAKDLDKRLPRLLLKAPSPPPGLVITMNGSDVTALIGIDSPVDLGDYKIRAKAPAFDDFEAEIEIAGEGKTVTVAIELEKASTKGPSKPDKGPSKPDKGSVVDTGKKPETGPSGPEDGVTPAPRSRRRTYAVIAAGAGGALIVTGLVFGTIARSKWNDAQAKCGDDLVCEQPGDLAEGNLLAHDARVNANISTALILGGAVAVGVGAVLWLTAPSKKPSSSTALRIAPHAGPGAVGVLLDGRF